MRTCCQQEQPSQLGPFTHISHQDFSTYAKAITLLPVSTCLLTKQRPWPAQDNANKPEGVAPNQGGKYVGFGSTPGPAPKPRGGEDLTAQLTKGFSQLSTVAGTHLSLCGLQL